MDVAGAAVGLVAAAPVLGVAALADPPRGRRARSCSARSASGRDGASFEVLKLRTMVVDAERQGAGSR